MQTELRLAHTGLRRALKVSTREVHDRIEALWAPDDRFETWATYRKFLETVLDVHSRAGVAAALSRGDQAEIDVEYRRIHALVDDLTLDTTPTVCTEQLSAAYGWGVGYVLNGSAIGANMILRDGFLEDAWPNRYLLAGQAYVKTGALQRFFAAMTDADPEPSEVLRGAQETFELFAEPVG